MKNIKSEQQNNRVDFGGYTDAKTEALMLAKFDAAVNATVQPKVKSKIEKIKEFNKDNIFFRFW